MIEDIGVLILAGGKSTRFGDTDKLRLTLNGRDLVQIALDKYTSVFKHVAISILSCYEYPILIKGAEVTSAAASKGLSILTAIEYFESIGIKSIILAEAARPFTCREHVDALVKLLECGSNAVISGFPTWESVYHMDGIVTVLQREKLLIGQTPEAWDLSTLKMVVSTSLYQSIDVSYSFAAVLSARKITVDLCTGTRENIKVTYPLDVTIAKAIADEYPELLTWEEQ